VDFTLSDEQVAIFDLAKSFGEENIAPHALEWEENQNIPKALWRDIASLGFGGLYVSEENGGSGLSRLDATLVFEALSMACPSVAAFLSIHNMCASMIDRYGSKNLIERVLPDALSMKNVISYCLTEPASGSDASALKTNAKKKLMNIII
jgi:alkylation response protein AidB-like acyl-CoA dehydrogenase